jgi:hypothetical protein
MKTTQFAALLGFLFIAAWAALDFGDAILCLIGASGHLRPPWRRPRPAPPRRS